MHDPFVILNYCRFACLLHSHGKRRWGDMFFYVFLLSLRRPLGVRDLPTEETWPIGMVYSVAIVRTTTTLRFEARGGWTICREVDE